jgi:hypothetical protein
MMATRRRRMVPSRICDDRGAMTRSDASSELIVVR